MIIARVIDAEGVTWIPEIALESADPWVELPIAPRLNYAHLTEGGDMKPLSFRTARAELERIDGGGTYIYRVKVML